MAVAKPIEKGMRVNSLTVIEESEPVYKGKTVIKPYRTVLVKCDCGNEKVLLWEKFRSGRYKSCGCNSRVKSISTHGHTVGGKNSPTYTSWSSMFQRIYNESCKEYPNYGGRGIEICERWDSKKGGSFDNFLEDMGERPDGCTLERKDVNGNYEPSNCKWEEWSVQQRNKRKSPLNRSGVRGVSYRKDTGRWEMGMRMSDGSRVRENHTHLSTAYARRIELEDQDGSYSDPQLPYNEVCKYLMENRPEIPRSAYMGTPEERQEELDSKAYCTNKSGVKGLYYDTANKKWRCEYRPKNGEKVYLGLYETKQLALQALENYKKALTPHPPQ